MTVDGRWCRVYFAAPRGISRPCLVVTYHRAAGRARDVQVEHPAGCQMPAVRHPARARQLTVSPRMLARMLKT